jgi:hypothetical protein
MPKKEGRHKLPPQEIISDTYSKQKVFKEFASKSMIYDFYANSCLKFVWNSYDSDHAVYGSQHLHLLRQKQSVDRLSNGQHNCHHHGLPLLILFPFLFGSANWLAFEI